MIRYGSERASDLACTCNFCSSVRNTQEKVDQLKNDFQWVLEGKHALMEAQQDVWEPLLEAAERNHSRCGAYAIGDQCAFCDVITKARNHLNTHETSCEHGEPHERGADSDGPYVFCKQCGQRLDAKP